MSKPWKDDNDDGIPPFDRKATRWLERAIRAKLQDPAMQAQYRFSEEDIDFIVDYLRVTTDFTEYVNWVDEDEYRGRRYSNGAWKIDWAAVTRYLAHGARCARRARTMRADNQRIGSLDQWLREDLAGTLAYAGDEGGSNDLPDELKRSLRAAAVGRSRGRKKRCSTCRHYFVAMRSNAVRCPDCIARAKGFERGYAAGLEDYSKDRSGL